MKHVIAILLAATLAGCSWIPREVPKSIQSPPEVQENPQESTLRGLPPLDGPAMTIGVYSFTDQTGQRRSNSSYATFSSAVTQAPDAYLIRALKHAGNGDFFTVVERVGLDNLTKERQLIRSAREQFASDEEKKKKLQPLLFAGVLIEGAVIAYESNLATGGAGARYLGIGMSRQYKQDTVTISLRTVSVSTGRVLLEVLVTKTILSASIDQDIFRFITDNTELVEIENGLVRNESINIALQTAIETAVLQTIKEGTTRGYWNIDEQIKTINCDADCIASIRG